MGFKVVGFRRDLGMTGEEGEILSVLHPELLRKGRGRLEVRAIFGCVCHSCGREWRVDADEQIPVFSSSERYTMRWALPLAWRTLRSPESWL
jgi:hypothetical protein